MLSRSPLAVVAATFTLVGVTPAAASAASGGENSSATAYEHARVLPGKPYAYAAGRKN
jgi:hypothetical protein